jgi:hypothetical protein
VSEFLDRRAFALIAKSCGKAEAESFYGYVGREHANSMINRRLIRQVGTAEPWVEMTNIGKMEMLKLASTGARQSKRQQSPVARA